MRKKRLLGRAAVSLLLLLFASIFTYAQTKTISGKVTDSKDGSPIAGVTIIPKGSAKGTTTAADGSFRITVSQQTNALIFSSVGFATQQLQISGSTLSVSLVAFNSSLNEVV